MSEIDKEIKEQNLAPVENINDCAHAHEKAVIKITPAICSIVALVTILGGILTWFINGSYMTGYRLFFAIQSAAFFGVISFAAIVDYKTKLVSNWTSVIIAILGLINLAVYIPAGANLEILSMAIGAIAISLPLFIAALVSKNGGVGGGDIKFMAACGLLLGLDRGIIALITGLLVAVLYNGAKIMIFKKGSKKETFALLPFLAIGCIISFYLQGKIF